jgi:hypothetical protein
LVESLAQLLDLMRYHGAHRIYAKRLSPNDNSKNQVYLGGGFSALNVIPHGDIYTDAANIAGSVRDRAKADVEFYWVDENGRHRAPDANLILYPKYPEVRMSGFLRGCNAAPGDLLTVRDEGRVLFFGVTQTGAVLGYATDAASPITAGLAAAAWPTLGVFIELPLSLAAPVDTRTILLGQLRRIYERQWIGSQKLARDGTKTPYSARNAGGYTLEAELGIHPNGNAEPDFMGWEIKQYGVRDFTKFAPKSVVTLMTPEPTGGLYKSEGVPEFLRRFGYADKNDKPDRINFGGVYTCQKARHAETGLRMILNGYDAAAGTITDMADGLALVTEAGEQAATWSFVGMMKHWNKKHAQAAYVPSLHRSPPPEYAYGPRILLCEETDFMLFLKAFASGEVYYDPAIKFEDASSAQPTLHRRSQFRVRHPQLTRLYHRHEFVSLGC